MDFTGLSRASLQDAMLNRLARIADLRKESKQHRRRLSDVRSELAAVQHELTQIEAQLERVVSFPSTPNAITVVEQPERKKKRA